MDRIESLQLTVLQDLDEIDPVGPQDDECIAELREVLERHGALQRFGITLLHQHFDLEDDEILVEHVDVENRTLLTRPMKLRDIGAGIETCWRLDELRAGRVCEKVCQQDRDSQGKPYHRTAHYTTS